MTEKQPPSRGVKIAAGVIVGGVVLACGIVGIVAATSGGSTDTATRSQLASNACEKAIKTKAGKNATFSKESYNKTKDPVWQVVGNVTAAGSPGVFTCTLKRDGDLFTVTASDFTAG